MKNTKSTVIVTIRDLEGARSCWGHFKLADGPVKNTEPAKKNVGGEDHE